MIINFSRKSPVITSTLMKDYVFFDTHTQKYIKPIPQVFHVCSTQGLKSSFLCPSGSIFNQRHFVCDWWYDFICEQALELYSLNDALNDPNSSTDPTVTPSSNDDNADRYNQLPLAPVQFNSISTGSNIDLSLASSGYTNNLRDEANLIYEDYNNGKM